MAIALVTSAKAAGLNGATTSSIDTTGATLLVISVAYGSSVTVADSKGNTWTPLTEQVQSSLKARLYYAENPTVGSGHTFTVTGTGVASSIIASAWSGAATSSVFDQETGIGSASTAAAGVGGAGTLTPASNDSLILQTIALNSSVSSFAGANGFTLLQHENFSSGTYYGIGSVYQIQTTATGVSNATVIESWTTSTLIALRTAVFKAGSTPATGVTMSGPSSGTVSVASTNFSIGVTPGGGTISGTVVVTPSDGGAGGTFTPTTVSLTTGSPTATFTYTPASTGVKTISVTNNGGLTNPSNISYTSNSAGSPAAGTASLSSSTATTINVTCGSASGGTPGYTYQWYRSTTSNFTPGGGNLLSGATSLTLADTASLSADTVYYYKLRVTDSVSATADSNQIAGALKTATLVLGFVGDSITAGYGLGGGLDPATKVGALLQKVFKHRAVTISNQAVSASRTSQWVSGQSNMTTALSAFSSAGVTHVHVMLGANDAAAANLVSASTYGTNLSNICSTLIGAGYTVILSYPTYIPAGANGNVTTAASVALAQDYQAQIDALVNHTTILRGDVLSHRYFVNALSEYQADLTHPTATGTDSLAIMWARAIDRALNKRSGGYARTVALTLTTDGSTAAAGLSGLRWAFWGEATPDLQSCPEDSGTGETTDGAGALSISVRSMLASGGVGWLVVTNSDGTTSQSPAHKLFAGPVTVS